MPESVEGLPFQSSEDGRVLKIIYLLGNNSGNDEWQCRYFRGRCFCVCVVLSTAENHVLCVELVVTTECIML